MVKKGTITHYSSKNKKNAYKFAKINKPYFASKVRVVRSKKGYYKVKEHY